MKVSIELQNGEEQTYECIERVDDNKYSVTLHDANGVVAIINKMDLKNLFSGKDS